MSMYMYVYLTCTQSGVMQHILFRTNPINSLTISLLWSRNFHILNLFVNRVHILNHLLALVNVCTHASHHRLAHRLEEMLDCSL